MTRQSLSKGVAACFLVIAMGAGSRADESFFDDFSNPDATNPVREPVTWRSVYGNIVIDNGDLLIGRSDSGLGSAIVDGFVAEDVAIEAQFRILQGTNVGMGVRAVGANINDCYYAELGGGNAGISRCGVIPLSGSVPVDLDAKAEDVAMRLQIVGDQLSLWVWPADAERPVAPLATAQHSALTEGSVALFVYDRLGGPSQAAFRYFNATVIPEPSTAVLLALAMIGALVWRRRQVPGACFPR